MDPVEFTLRSGRRVVVRPPQPGEAAALLEFIKALTPGDTFVTVDASEYTLEDETRWLRGVLDGMGRGQAFHLVAEAHGRIVATCEIRRRGRRSEHVGALGIAVRDGWRDDGLGSQLVAMLLEGARGLGLLKAYLRVFGSNAPAIHVYEKLGFRECGRIPGGIRYRGDYVDEVLMVCEL